MPDSRVRVIALRWPGRCCLCAREMRVGEHARWDPARHTVRCLDCAAWARLEGSVGARLDRTAWARPDCTAGARPEGSARERLDRTAGARQDCTAGARQDCTAGARQEGSSIAPEGSISPAPIAPGVAGASAMREYERRRRARERRARARFGVMGVWLSRLTGDPSSTRVWRQGAEGEAKVAARLTKLMGDSGVRLLHDRRLTGKGHANIDHIAIGPGGVTVIDAKALRGEVRVETAGGVFSQRERLLRVSGRDRTRLVRGVQMQGAVVRERLAESGLHMVDVRCALCFANTDGLPWLRRLELDGVVLAGPRRVAKLAQRPGALGEAEVQRVLHALAEVLAPA